MIPTDWSAEVSWHSLHLSRLSLILSLVSDNLTLSLWLQERDGYKDQVETLRDKVSLLARDLADNQDNSVSQGGRIASLEEKLHTAEEELASHKIKLEQMDEAIQKSEDQSAEQQKRLQALQEELQEACDAHARAIKSWMNEKQILCQVRFPRAVCALKAQVPLD